MVAAGHFLGGSGVDWDRQGQLRSRRESVSVALVCAELPSWQAPETHWENTRKIAGVGPRRSIDCQVADGEVSKNICTYLC